MMENIGTVIISRTDGIGDVILTLPVAHLLKQKFPNSRIIFLGKTYTKPILECCLAIDGIICMDEISEWTEKNQLDYFKSLKADCILHVFPDKHIAALAKKAGVALRIGTSHRLFHWLTCNKLLNFTRKNSTLHESQLNLKLLEPLGIKSDYSLKEIQFFFEFTRIGALPSELNSLIDKKRCNLILHPKSKGSAQEWGLPNFKKLIELLPANRFKIFITGIKEEGEMFKSLIPENSDDVVNMAGKMNLTELISFIKQCDALVAASTGPLHIAAVLGKKAIGIYPSLRPMHPGRWSPVGEKTHLLTSNQTCANCKKGNACSCLSSVSPQKVAMVLLTD
jgi:heptosyltransferase III